MEIETTQGMSLSLSQMGQSNNRENTMRQAKLLKDKGIHLFVAGVGKSSLHFISQVQEA